MGYTTTFKGRFDLDKPLTAEHAAYLHKFNRTRRMKRDPQKAEALPDPKRLAAGLPSAMTGRTLSAVWGSPAKAKTRRSSTITRPLATRAAKIGPPKRSPGHSPAFGASGFPLRICAASSGTAARSFMNTSPGSST